MRHLLAKGQWRIQKLDHGGSYKYENLLPFLINVVHDGNAHVMNTALNKYWHPVHFLSYTINVVHNGNAHVMNIALNKYRHLVDVCLKCWRQLISI